MSLILKGNYTLDDVTGNKYWKNKAKIKFNMYNMDTREDLIKAGYNIKFLDEHQGLIFNLTKIQFHNWVAIQVICGIVFIENDENMNDYHNYVICKLAKNFGLQLTPEFLSANEETIQNILKKATKENNIKYDKQMDNIFLIGLFMEDIKTWNFIIQSLARDIDAEWWCVPNNFKRNSKFSIKMLKNQYNEMYWKDNEEQ